MAKRLFDIVLSFALIILLLPILSLITIVVFMRDGRPILYVSERMKGVSDSFKLFKFRTMRHEKNDTGATGIHKNNRITKNGAFLRKYRIDEIPQLFNVLFGDMSFVGPRPPLRQYVEKYPEIYRSVLRDKPGVTGLASLHFHKHEDRILRRAVNSDHSEELYCTLCIPRKAKLDLIYRREQNLCFDLIIIFKTFAKVLK